MPEATIENFTVRHVCFPETTVPETHPINLNIRLIANVLPSFCFVLTVMWGQNARCGEVSNMRLDGFIAIQGEMENTDNIGIDDVEAELTLKTPRKKRTRAVITVDGKFYRRCVYLEDLYIDHRFNSKLRLTVGISKKVLGLEYENGRKYRASIHRSPIYQKMESLGIVGRQFNLKLSGKTGSGDGLKWSGALGADGTRDMNALVSIEKPFGNFGVGTWLMLEAHKVGSYYDPAYSHVFSFWANTDFLRIAIELFTGNDTKQTEYNEIFGDDRIVFFGGTKFEVRGKHRFSKELTLNPVFQTSFWTNDLDNYLDNTLHFLLGARFKFQRIAVSLNGEITGDRTANSNRRVFNDKALYVEIFFDF